MAISAPEPLGDHHRLDDFNCIHSSLTNWLLGRARHNQREGASRCYVVCDSGTGDGYGVVGYYCIAAGSVSQEIAPGRIRRNMPDPIPVVVLGRLAVHADYERRGIGSGLLKDATRRCIRLAGEMGMRAMLCHAIDEDARAFYLKNGFVPSPIGELTVMLNINDLARRLAAQGG